MKAILALLALVVPLGLTASCIFVAEGRSSHDLEYCADCGQYVDADLCCSDTGETCVKSGKDCCK